MTWHQINEGREDHRVIMMTLGGCSCIWSGEDFAASLLGKLASQARRPNPLEPRRGSGVCGLTNGVQRRREPAKKRNLQDIGRKGIGKGTPPLRVLAPPSSHTCATAPQAACIFPFLMSHGFASSLCAATDGHQQISSSLLSPSRATTPSARSTSNQRQGQL
jgi:hypothetical protein